ncbi:NAD(P)-dependent glycerol-3-phosphate dehydrogenase [Candidatus Woesearchaeota archaeon]|nr:NAD(P)-dependent glycerol-3-phosphate dehydrogenase [Candidatus Woesearchaeota archaeon]
MPESPYIESPYRYTISRVAILGAGAFGFALASLLSENHPKLPIVLYDPVKEFVDGIRDHHCHPVFHKGVVVPSSVTATTMLPDAVRDADLVIFAVPGQFVRGAAKSLVPLLQQNTAQQRIQQSAPPCAQCVIILNVAKALEPDTHKPLLEVISEELRAGSLLPGPVCPLAVLSGGMIADEVSKHWPIGADIACTNLDVARQLQLLFSSPTFKVNITRDVLGVQLAGALKNVVAIGAGLFDGLGYDDSSKAAFVSEAAREMKHFALQLGAHAETFELGGQAWLGDLLTTCFGKSRNRYLGELLGKGKSVEEALHILEQEKKRAEGYLTTKAFYELAKEYGLHMPILAVLYGVLFSKKPVQRAIVEFIAV